MTSAPAIMTWARSVKAIRCYTRALSLAPCDPQPHSNLGAAFQQSGRAREAIRCYRRALELDRYSVSAATNLGSLLVSRGRLRAAKALLGSLPEELAEDAQIEMLWMDIEQVEGETVEGETVEGGVEGEVVE